MTQFDCKKVENCFGAATIYEYRLPVAASEEFVTWFGAIGSLKIHRNFPRPFFQASLSDGTTVKGVLADSVIKVDFPKNAPQDSKDKFEIFLEEMLNRQIAGRER
jgi:hypothetical protein